MKRIIVKWILTAIALSCANAMLDGMSIDASRTLMLSSLLLALVDGMAEPLLKAYEVHYSFIILCIVTFLFNALVIFVMFKLVPGMDIDTIGTAFLASIFITVTARLIDLVVHSTHK